MLEDYVMADLALWDVIRLRREIGSWAIEVTQLVQDGGARLGQGESADCRLVGILQAEECGGAKSSSVGCSSRLSHSFQSAWN